MSIAFIGTLDVRVIDRIWEFGPLDDITIRALHMNHAMQLEEDEYIFTVPVGTTLGERKQKLLDAEFRKFGWLHDELPLWEKMCPCVEYNDLDDFEDDTTLCLKLVNRITLKRRATRRMRRRRKAAKRLKLTMIRWLL